MAFKREFAIDFARVALWLVVLGASVPGQKGPGNRPTKPREFKTHTVRLHARKTPKARDYVRATMSFEYATRDDAKRVANDWDLALMGLGVPLKPFVLDPRTVTNDKSLLWDVGDLPLAKADKASVKKKGVRVSVYDDTRAGLPCLLNHTYILHTQDQDSDFWVKFRVTKLTPNRSIVIAWELLTKPQRRLDAQRKRAADEKRRAAKANAARRRKGKGSRR